MQCARCKPMVGCEMRGGGVVVPPQSHMRPRAPPSTHFCHWLRAPTFISPASRELPNTSYRVFIRSDHLAKMATFRCTFTAQAVRSVRQPCPRAVAVGASRVAEPVSIPVKSADGADSGTASLALKVADPETARHVVHRSLLTAHASRRQVRCQHAQNVCFWCTDCA